MEVKLKDETKKLGKDVVVKIKDSLSWGDSQKIQSVMMSGAKMTGKATRADDMGFDFDPSKMLEARYVTLECAINEIKEGDQTKKFTREWMDNLSQEDGDHLMEEVDKLGKKDKGTPSS